MQAKTTDNKTIPSYKEAYRYIKIRFGICFIFAASILFFILKVNLLSTLLIAYAYALVLVFPALFLRNSIQRGWMARFGQGNVNNVTDSLLLRFDLIFISGLPVLLFPTLYKNPDIINQIEVLVLNKATTAALISIAILYYGLVFFVYKKRLFYLYSLFLISLPITGGIVFMKDVITISMQTELGLTLYTTGIGLFLASTSAFDYFDENIQKTDGYAKLKWNELVGFIAWDFLGKPKKSDLTRKVIEKKPLRTVRK